MVAALTACLDVAGPPAGTGATGPTGFTGIEETEDGLALLTTPCSFVDAGTMTIALAAGEYALVGLSSSGDLRVNGKPCGAATAASTKKINITGSADGGDETVVLDYLRGSFVPGISTSAGVVIDLKGGTGDVLKLRGSSGNDTVVLGTSTTGVGAAGTFAISLAFDGGTPDGYKDLTITNTETVVVSTGPGADVVSGAGVSYGTGSLAFGAVTSGTSPRLVVYGGEGADALTGGNGDDTLWGGAGDDTLFEGSTANGADTLSGGSEADGGPGLDTVRYESRTSSLTLVLGGGAVSGAMLADGGFERDALEASLEVVNGGSGNDVMSCAGEAACTLHGNGGNDVLTGGSLADTLWGEAGNDTIVPGLGDDVVDCGAGTADVVSYADRGASASLDVTLGAGGAAQSGSGEASEDDSIAACEHIVGGAGDDVLTGNELDNRLTGGAGDDVLWGLAGNDTFDEGAGPNGGDTFHGGDGEDLVDYSARTGALSCDLSDDTANDGEGSEADDLKLDVEDVTGGSGGSTIIGSSSDNKIDPGSGTNTVTCGDGFDILIPNGSTTNAASDCEAASAPLVSIVVTPANPTSIKSSTRLFTATGRYSDSTTQNLTASPTLTWASSNTSVAIISNAAGSRGLSSTIAPGSTIISATVGAVTGTTSFTVLAASLTSITVTPNNVSVALGFTRTFLAIGGYSDGSTQDLSSQVTWTSSVEAVAIISNATGSQGLTSSLSVGTTSIGAVLGAVSGTSSLTVTGPTLVGPIVVTPSSPSLSVSGTQQLTASADYSDGSTQDITASVTWASSAPAVATVSSEGLATGVSGGAATVTATLGGLSGSTTVTVTP
jgi:Ca2+-binding RTX toxin-like protein